MILITYASLLHDFPILAQFTICDEASLQTCALNFSSYQILRSFISIFSIRRFEVLADVQKSIYCSPIFHRPIPQWRERT